MQNKGLVKWTAIALIVICAYYLSFSVVSNYYENKAKAYAQGDAQKQEHYIDSLSMQKVWLGHTLKDVRERELGLGLDLKGGMTVILELNTSDVLETLSDNSQDPTFREALEAAQAKQERSQKDFITLFTEEFHNIDPGARLSAIFGTSALREKISTSSTDAEVIKVLRSELQTAIDSSYKVLRNRIDRFGVVAPNIQRLEGGDRILVELPGVKEPERVRKLLQGSANLEFWECYLLPEIWSDLQRADEVIQRLNSHSQSTETEVANAEEIEGDSLASDSINNDDQLAALAGTTATNEPQATEGKQITSLFSLLQPNLYEGG